jgi:cobalt/nickel transport system permease protein
MHISDSVLAAPVLAAGAVLAAGGVGYGLRRLPWERMMTAGLLSSAFFVASLIHIPLGPGSVHLILNGLMGAVLGWAALPAMAAALFLQALLYQFGGLVVLGVNICIMAFPAVGCGLLFRRWFAGRRRVPAAFACGFLSIFCSALLCALALALSGDAFLAAAWGILLAHIPVMFIEGGLTAVIVSFLAKIAPEMLAPGHSGL